MEVKIARLVFSDPNTISEITLDNVPFTGTLEDSVSKGMDLIKTRGGPTERIQIRLNISDYLQKLIPSINKVPAISAIHSNPDADTSTSTGSDRTKETFIVIGHSVSESFVGDKSQVLKNFLRQLISAIDDDKQLCIDSTKIL